MPFDTALAPTKVVDESFEAGAARLRHSSLKRIVDIFGAASGLILLAPLLLLVALLVRLESAGPALYRQRRTGRDGRAFVILKFRTMTVVEDDHAVVQAVKNDSRLTRIGAFLRRSSVDELPQLINVLRGEMSLVGPRPHALVHDEYYAGVVNGYTLRFEAKPGLTGLAQVNGCRGETSRLKSMVDRVELDVEYIRRWSILLDIEILLRTLLIGPLDPKAH